MNKRVLKRNFVFIWFKRIAIAVLTIAISLYLAFKYSPWPAALLIRHTFEKDAKKTNQALEKHVPKGISEILNLQYSPNDEDALLDIYYPDSLVKSDQKLPVIVWIHGGGWISGNKSQLQNYCKILASYGYIVASVGYSIAPEKRYPTPLKQTAAALEYLQENSDRIHINSGSFFLAGDSGGAHIVAQTASIISNASYSKLLGIKATIKASQLSGVILYCGPYDLSLIDLNSSFGPFLKTVLWSYGGKKDFDKEPYFKTASIIDYVDKNYPPCFISAGNGDPLLEHSVVLAKKLGQIGIKTDTLFFPQNWLPKLPHEYQFNLDNEAGKIALKRSLQFLKENEKPVAK